MCYAKLASRRENGDNSPCDIKLATEVGLSNPELGIKAVCLEVE